MFRKNQLLPILGIIGTISITACGDLDPASNGNDNTNPDGGAQTTTAIVTKDEGGGVTSAIVDAHAEDAWIYLDLETKSEVKPTDAANDTKWDLAFQRFQIRTNGGVSGSAGGGAARLAGQKFADLTTAPKEGYLTDAADGDDEGTDPDFAFLAGDGWYKYDVSTHRLDPQDAVYVVKSAEGHYFKVQLLGYYDAAGSSGHPSLRWASVSEPPQQPADEITVDASSSEAWAYVKLNASGAPVAGDSTTWDLAVQRTSIRTNSGSSGSGFGGAQVAASKVFGEITTSPTTGFTVDAMLPKAGPPGSGEISSNAVLSSWYNYDSSTHQVSPKDEVYLFRTAVGTYAKLQVKSYAGGKFTFRIAPVTRQVNEVTLTVDASESGKWIAFSLRKGAVIEVADLSTSTEWDLAFSRTKIRTNSGTSGAGTAGALDLAKATLAEITAAPTEGYTIDAMAPIPGPPGSGEESANAVVGSWYNYDPTTHAVTPKDTTYGIRAADGTYAKLKITGWSSGQLGVTFAYAGPAQTSF